MHTLGQAPMRTRLRTGSEALGTFSEELGPQKSSQGASRWPPNHQKCFLSGPGASWSVPTASRRCPGDVRGALEAAQKRPSTAQGVPKSASGTPKDAAKAPQAASDFLFLSSPALLQKSSFYGVKSWVLEVPGTWIGTSWAAVCRISCNCA